MYEQFNSKMYYHCCNCSLNNQQMLFQSKYYMNYRNNNFLCHCLNGETQHKNCNHLHLLLHILNIKHCIKCTIKFNLIYNFSKLYNLLYQESNEKRKFHKCWHFHSKMFHRYYNCSLNNCLMYFQSKYCMNHDNNIQKLNCLNDIQYNLQYIIK